MFLIGSQGKPTDDRTGLSTPPRGASQARDSPDLPPPQQRPQPEENETDGGQSYRNNTTLPLRSAALEPQPFESKTRDRYLDQLKQAGADCAAEQAKRGQAVTNIHEEVMRLVQKLGPQLQRLAPMKPALQTGSAELEADIEGLGKVEATVATEKEKRKDTLREITDTLKKADELEDLGRTFHRHLPGE